MSHRNARLTPRGRRLLVERVHAGMPISHAARSMGISRQCAHRWVVRFETEGVPGLEDRSSRPRHSPSRTSEADVARILEARRARREGPAFLSESLGIPARTISRVLARCGEPHLCALDPMTGEVIRASRATTHRYERSRPGELVHVDVKKLGRIPDGGGWRARGRNLGKTGAQKRARIGFDYVHSMVDDHTRLAYSEVLPDETGPTCAGFLTRATTWLEDVAHARVEAVMTDNAFNYRLSNDFQQVLATLDARHVLIRPHCPWQNGKVERFNRTLQVEWAYRQVFTTNAARTAALGAWLERYNYTRPHGSLGGRPPISRAEPT